MRVSARGIVEKCPAGQEAKETPMGIVPEKRLEKIEWYEARIQTWTTNVTQLGLVASQCTALAAKILNARSFYSAHVEAQAAAKAATQAFHDAVREMHSDPGMGADMIQEIKTYAETTNNPSVYTLAMIPPPAKPGTVPPPALPEGFRVEIGQSGNLILRWKASNPPGSSGTVYLVERRLNNTGNFAFIGAAGGDKTYDDTTLPAGLSQVEYRVRGQRSGVTGPAAVWTVRVGGGGGVGGLVITEQFAGEDDGTSVKMAA
jgi:hypothetical protein